MSAARPKTRRQPGITLELVETIQTANLARREADLAVRHYPPESGDLYISKLGVFAGAVYRRIGTEARDWVTYPEEQGHFPMPRWVEQRVRETERFGGAPCLRHADAPHGDPRRGGARDSSVLYRGRRSAARTCCPAGARNLVRVLAHRPPRLAARRVRASDYGLGPIPFQKRTRPPRRYLLNGNGFYPVRPQKEAIFPVVLAGAGRLL